MELTISGKNMEITPAVRRHVERKLGKLDRYLSSIIGVKVELFEESTKSPQLGFGVQVTADGSGIRLRGESRGKDLFVAIDKVTAIMERQARNYKEKRYDKGRGSSLARGGFGENAEPAPQAEVVKIKRFLVKSMTLEEAIDQMEILGHDFFLFFNAEEEELNLLYRRKDGNYGLIEPELG